MLRAVYNALWWLVAPLAVLRLLIRSRKERGYREHIGERFGHVAKRRADDLAPLIWVHAVSFGETRAAQPLIDSLMKAHPEARVLLTHMTPSGRATGVELFGDRVLRSYLPYDLPILVRRFLPAIKAQAPGSAWLMNLLHITKTKRSEYDHLMLHLHDAMKADLDYQKNSPQETMPFPPGSVWVCFSDHTSHAVMSGQFMMEQTFFLPVKAMARPDHAPLGILERLKGRALV